MAGLTKKANGTWLARMRVNNPLLDDHGKTKAAIIKDPATGQPFMGSKARAKVLAEAMNTDLNRGTMTTSLETFGPYAVDYVTNRYGEVSDRTRQLRLECVERYINPILGTTQINKIKSRDIERLFTRLREDKGLSHATIKVVWAALCVVMKQAAIDGIQPNNPCLVVDQKHVRGVKKAWNPDDDMSLPEGKKKAFPDCMVGSLLAEADEANLQPVVAVVNLCLFLGLRRGEALGLRWKDWKHNQRTIEVRQQVVDANNDQGWDVSRLKTDDSVRALDVDDNLSAFLTAWKAKMEDLHQKLGCEMPEFICEVPGFTYKPASISARFRWLAERVGVEDVEHRKLHSLRHLHATKLLANPENTIVAVSKRLGHANIQTTLSTYTHEMDGMGERLAMDVSTWSW